MGLARTQRVWLQRVVAAVLVVIGIPVLFALATISEDAPVAEGEPAPRTIRAEGAIRIVDNAATEARRTEEADKVVPVQIFDDAAQADVVRAVRDVFAAVEDARAPVVPESQAPAAAPSAGVEPAPAQPAPQPTIPAEVDQVEMLRRTVTQLDVGAIETLVGLTNAQLRRLEGETVAVAQELARQPITQADLEEVLGVRLRVELNVRDFRDLPAGIEDTVVKPLITAVMRPTVRTDDDKTQAARDRAAEQVPDVIRTWRTGEAIVRQGELVDPIQIQALQQSGLEGTDPRVAVLRSVGAMAMVVLVALIYLRSMQPKVWRSGRKTLLLGILTFSYAAIVIGVSFLAEALSSGWWYAVPAGAFAMLTAILVAPVVGIAVMLPSVVLVVLMAPGTVGAAVFAAAAVLISVPLVTSMASRGDLRSATLRAGLAYPVVAVIIAAVFGASDQILIAFGAGLINGAITAVLVQGLLPFLETIFQLPTVTALLDLADRNHPLLRELEQKALGSYNHSVMVANLVERACREIGADPLLGSVAALYHDIGKVRQPHFFIENQQGIANPHDDIEAQVSAVIIQNHVIDGVEMAREYRLPPEVVAAIGSHHGTMLVTYFYRKALDAVGGDIDKVDQDHFRYKGQKPRRKEAAVLLMADCSEAATRSAAMSRGTLPREQIESMVDQLILNRVEDGQFDECDLTFAEMQTVRTSIVEALVGIYHPRIAYPGSDDPKPPPAPAPESAEALAAAAIGPNGNGSNPTATTADAVATGGADIEGADIEGAEVAGADGEGAEVAGADIEGADAADPADPVRTP